MLCIVLLSFHPLLLVQVQVQVPLPVSSHAGVIGRSHSDEGMRGIVCMRLQLTRTQSGQSLIEHSYKADSDLSPAGWEYAERLKAAVIARRKAAREERKAKGEVLGEENPLLASIKKKT